MAFVEELVSFVNMFGFKNIAMQTSNPLLLDIDGNSPMRVNHMDWGGLDDTAQNRHSKRPKLTLTATMSVCTVFGIYTHCLPVPVEWKIFQMQQLIGKSSLEIAHHSLCQGLWITKGWTKMTRDWKMIKKLTCHASFHPIFSNWWRNKDHDCHRCAKRKASHSEYCWMKRSGM